MKGHLDVTVFDPCTKYVREVVCGPNLVLDTALEEMAHLISGDVGTALASRAVKHMQFGTGRVSEVATQTALITPITPMKTVISSYPNDGLSQDWFVQFETFLLQNEGNGFVIAEAGLVTGNLKLITRKVFSPLSKTSKHIFRFRWTLQT